MAAPKQTQRSTPAAAVVAALIGIGALGAADAALAHDPSKPITVLHRLLRRRAAWPTGLAALPLR